MNETVNKPQTENPVPEKEKVSPASSSSIAAPTDIYENQQGVTLMIDMPGVSKESLEIDVDKNVLTIKGLIDLTTPQKMKPTYMDVRSSVFERRFTLGEQLDSSRINASLNQGELQLFIPRSERHKPRKINVTSE